MANVKHNRIAILWRGDREARRTTNPQNNRFNRVFEELAALGIHAEPAVYADDIADEVREQLLTVDGVLVWVDPIHEGKTRTVAAGFVECVTLQIEVLILGRDTGIPDKHLVTPDQTGTLAAAIIPRPAFRFSGLLLNRADPVFRGLAITTVWRNRTAAPRLVAYSRFEASLERWGR